MAASLLNQYQISKVQLSVGLSPDLGDDKKKEVQDWLDKRLKSEFGTKAKGEVTFINKLIEQTPEKSFLDHLKNFQDLAGQVVLALALLIGALLWGLLASKNSQAKQLPEAKPQQRKPSAEKQAKTACQKIQILRSRKKQKEEERLAKEIAEITQKISSLLPQLANEFKNVLRSWCEQGEAGRIRLVCFAEAVGKEIGKLPIPVDALGDVKNVFAQMPHMQQKESETRLKKRTGTSWLYSVLGADSLNQPFSYIGGLNVTSVSEVLIEQNPKMRTLVALYMSDDLRSEYMSSLDEQTKIQILQSATELNEIPLSEFKDFDGKLSAKVKGRGKGGEGMVQLEMTLQKIVMGLAAIEKITLLKDLKGAGMEQFKKTTASLAFLHQWPDGALAKLVGRANSDGFWPICV